MLGSYVIMYKGDKVRAARNLDHARIIMRHIRGAELRHICREVEIPPTNMLRMPFSDFRANPYISID